MVRAIASPLVALLALASPPLVAGAAAVSSSPVTALPSRPDRVVPADRGIDPDDRDGDGRPDKEEEPEQLACPTELWNIPVEIDGLACILLLPKETPDEEENEQDEPGRRGPR